MNNFFEKIFKSNSLTQEVGFDLGTSKISVYLKNKGIVLNEPSVVAVNNKTDQIVAIGKEASAMIGKTPQHITATKPLVNGVISDFEVAEKMIGFILQKIKDDGKGGKFWFIKRAVVGVPSNCTEVEKKAVEDVFHNAGVKEVFLIEKSLAIAIGSGLLLKEPKGHLIVDIGGGITEVAVISLGGVVVSQNIRIAGDKLNEDIIRYIKDNFKLAIGDQTAEKIKIGIGSAVSNTSASNNYLIIQGRDLTKGLPKEIKITDKEVREALSESLDTIVQTVKNTIETAPPELIPDIMNHGILLTGGTSLLKGIDKLIESSTGLEVNIADDPINTVVRGEGIILENFEGMKAYLLSTITNN